MYSDQSIEDIRDWGSSVLQSSPTLVQSTRTSRQAAVQEMQHKELGCDVVEYRHPANLSNQRDHRSRSYTNSPKHRYPPTDSTKRRQPPNISQQRHEQSSHQHAVTVSKKSVDSQIQVGK